MKKIFISIILLTSCLFGDALKFEIGIFSNSLKTTGNIQKNKNNSKIDVKDELDMEKIKNNTIEVIFEHPVPIIPNIKISQTKINKTTTNTNKKFLLFDDKLFKANKEIETTFTLSQTEAILYYELSEGIIIPLVHLDIGLGIDNGDGTIQLKQGDIKSEEKFHILNAVAYGYIMIETSALPIVPIDFEYTRTQSIGNKALKERYGIVSNFEIVVGFDIGFRLGVKKEKIVYDKKDLDINIKQDGYYFGGYINW